MNSLELHMLWTLQFDCNVSRAEYDACQAALGALDADSEDNVRPKPEPCTSSLRPDAPRGGARALMQTSIGLSLVRATRRA